MIILLLALFRRNFEHAPTNIHLEGSLGLVAEPSLSQLDKHTGFTDARVPEQDRLEGHAVRVLALFFCAVDRFARLMLGVIPRKHQLRPLLLELTFSLTCGC